jgi:RNA polymerase sigma factor (sigma-70 family)|tara:strand:- start:2252 stop:2944 length:693 start_codon:yes stop_codon:yes gene_type:complete
MAEGENEKLKFEDCIDRIDAEIQKRKSKWKLTSITWMDFDDISQILRIHIYKKWDMYDPSKPLAPWLNRIITNQIKNLIRNNYGNYARPCLRCAASEGGDLCVIYEKQSSTCPLYAYWEKNKKVAHDIKVPVSLENHKQDVFNMENHHLDIDAAFRKLNEILPKVLKPIEWKIYENLYIKNLSEEEVAKLMGYKTSEKNRSPGYKQIKNIKKSIILKVKKLIKNGNLDII